MVDDLLLDGDVWKRQSNWGKGKGAMYNIAL